MCQKGLPIFCSNFLWIYSSQEPFLLVLNRTKLSQSSSFQAMPCSPTLIFASKGLRSALLIFTLGIAMRIFVIPTHCHLLDFDSYAPCNDVIFSQSTRGFHFLSFECPENWLKIVIGSVSWYKLFVRIV